MCDWKRIGADIHECPYCGGIVITADIDVYKYCHQCGKFMHSDQVITNRDKLRVMSNEDLSRFIYNTASTCEMCTNSRWSDVCERYICKDLNVDCSKSIEEWLESEVEND